MCRGRSPWKDWPVTVPRTCRWFTRFVKDVNTSPQSRTGQWTKELGINDADRVKCEHAHLCDMLQMVMTCDQLDVSSLGCFELLVRRLQMLEQAYGANPKAPRFDAQTNFMGKGKNNVAVAPALVAHHAPRMWRANCETMRRSPRNGAQRARKRPCARRSNLLELAGGRAHSRPSWTARNSACCVLAIARIC